MSKTPCSLFEGLSRGENGDKTRFAKLPLSSPPSPPLHCSIVQNDDGAPLNIDRLSSSVIEELNRPGFQILNICHGNLANVININRSIF